MSVTRGELEIMSGVVCSFSMQGNTHAGIHNLRRMHVVGKIQPEQARGGKSSGERT